MNYRRPGFLLFLACVFAAVWMLYSPTQVDVVTGATKKAAAPAPAPAPKPSSAPVRSSAPSSPSYAPNSAAPQPVWVSGEYFYKIVKHDATVDVKQMKVKDAERHLAELKGQYADALKNWQAMKANWVQAMGEEAVFPVPQPVSPSCEAVTKVPVDGKLRAKAREALQQRLDVWTVSLVSDCGGEKGAVLIRQDQLLAKWSGLTKTYCEKMLAAKAGSGTAEADIQKPSLKVLKEQLSESLAKMHLEECRTKLAEGGQKQ